MKYTKRETLALLGGASLSLLPGLSLAEETAATTTETEMAPKAEGPVVHEVLMLNKHPDNKKQRMVFVPDIVRAMPGDTVKFIPQDKGHNSQSDAKMMPEGAAEWKSKVSKEFEVTLEAEGTYGYYCTPHRNLGMVGLILVGDPSSNYEDAKAVKHKSKAKAVFADIFERADALIAAENES